MMPGQPPAVRSATSSTPQVASFSATGLNNSSPEAFSRSVAPYAERVSKATGIPAEALIGMAANETGYGKFAEGNDLFGIKGRGPAGSFNTPLAGQRPVLPLLETPTVGLRPVLPPPGRRAQP